MPFLFSPLPYWEEPLTGAGFVPLFGPHRDNSVEMGKLRAQTATILVLRDAKTSTQKKGCHHVYEGGGNPPPREVKIIQHPNPKF